MQNYHQRAFLVAAVDPKDSLASLEPMSLVTVINGQVRSRPERDEYKYFKHFDDWANGFIMIIAIMLEVFKLSALTSAQLRFYQGGTRVVASYPAMA
jgi:hypothetical protein